MANFVMPIVIAVVLVIIAGAATIPLIKDSTTLETQTDSLEYTNTSENQTFALSVTDDLVSGGLSIAGLTVDDNYTVSYDSSDANVTILAGTTEDTYSAVYTYEPAGYISDSTERTLYGLMTLVVIIGIVYFLFRGFGVD